MIGRDLKQLEVAVVGKAGATTCNHQPGAVPLVDRMLHPAYKMPEKPAWRGASEWPKTVPLQTAFQPSILMLRKKRVSNHAETGTGPASIANCRPRKQNSARFHGESLSQYRAYQIVLSGDGFMAWRRTSRRDVRAKLARGVIYSRS